MGRHIRLKHSTYMCFWRCPVISCSLWFTAELNAKDHIEGIHKFKEGEGISFYECLRRHGVEWFGSRTFFDQRKVTNQAIWMDMALARRSGQELRNCYIITNSTEHAPLRRFFKAAVDALQLVFDRSLVTSVQPKSLLIQMREAVANCFFKWQLDAAVATSRHSRGDISGGVVYGSGDAGRSFPRSHHSSSDAGKSPTTTSRGRPTRGLHTTTCEISTGGARPLHREFQSFVGTCPASYGPVVTPYSRRDSFVAGGRSPRHTSRRKPRREGRATKYRGIAALRPCGALGQLCLCRRR